MPFNVINITGQRFGRLVALKFLKIDKRSKTRKTLWLFQCDCGRKIEASYNSVKSGYRKSCDCLRLNQKGKLHPQYIHGRSKSKKYLFERHLIFAYNLTISKYEELKKLQNNLCAICKLKKKLYVDHNHNTGKVRGLLCHKCNIRLGFIEKDNLLKQTLQYLEIKND